MPAPPWWGMKAQPRDGDGWVDEGRSGERFVGTSRPSVDDLRRAFQSPRSSASGARGRYTDTVTTVVGANRQKILVKETLGGTGSFNEQVSARLAELMGAPVPRAYSPSDPEDENLLVFEYVEGVHPPIDQQRWLDAALTPDGRRLALFEVAIGAWDRHNLNFILTPDGDLVGIDYESTWGRRVLNDGQSEVTINFFSPIVEPYVSKSGHSFTSEEVAEARAHLMTLEPEFKKVNPYLQEDRMEEFTAALERLDWLDAHLDADVPPEAKGPPPLWWGETKAQPRDGDGDGWIDEGKPTERLAARPIVQGGTAGAWRERLSDEDQSLMKEWQMDRSPRSYAEIRSGRGEKAERFRAVVGTAPTYTGLAYHGTSGIGPRVEGRSADLLQPDWEARLGREIKIPGLGKGVFMSMSTESDIAGGFGAVVLEMEVDALPNIGTSLYEVVGLKGTFTPTATRIETMNPVSFFGSRTVLSERAVLVVTGTYTPAPIEVRKLRRHQAETKSTPPTWWTKAAPRDGDGDGWINEGRLGEAYVGLHRPQKAAPSWNLGADGAIPEDVYDHPEWYVGDPGSEAMQETLKALHAIRGNPEAEITIYRGAPEGATINEGDWVSLSRTYAQEMGMHDEDPSQDMPVHSLKVRARDVWYAGDDLNEFGYWPEPAAPERRGAMVRQPRPQTKDFDPNQPRVPAGQPGGGRWGTTLTGLLNVTRDAEAVSAAPPALGRLPDVQYPNVRVVTASNGDKAVVKTDSDPWGAQREVLTSRLAAALGAPTPLVGSQGDDLLIEFVDGGHFNMEDPEASHAMDDVLARAAQTPQGRRLALLEALVGASDRNGLNYLFTDPDDPGTIIGIDYEYSLDADETEATFPHYSPLAAALGVPMFGDTAPDHGFTAAEIADARQAAISVRDEFEARDDLDQWSMIIDRIEALEAALGRKSIPPSWWR